ncbi:zinc finger protein 574 isoform X1 [Tachysurus fulvidraco]|uniref:zinc finger protein 574 isoform X1 n=2 Tax=Tachysurus fulvidraco TaxID=1234273 RepID=UPI000F50CEDB|nr:zinc finger protein 574 isoform X1 [Tachysurus fulvidraco]
MLTEQQYNRLNSAAMESSSVYMCFPCYREFPTLEEVLTHQLTCTAENTQPLTVSTALEAAAISAGLPELEAQYVPEVQSERNAILSSDVPRVLYQCADCELLFDALLLWQQHRKLGCGLEPGAEPEHETEPEHESRPEEVAANLVSQAVSQLIKDQSEVYDDYNDQPVESDGGANHAASVEIFTPVNKELTETSPEGDPHLGLPGSSDLPEEPAPQLPECTEPVQEPSPQVRRRGQKKVKSPSSLLCVECGRCFSLASELVTHRKTAHNLKEAIHLCNVCGEGFLNTTLFLYHRKQHRSQTLEDEQKEVEVPQLSTALLEASGEGLLLLATAGEGQSLMEITSLEQTVSETVPMPQVEVELDPEIRGEVMQASGDELVPQVVEREQIEETEVEEFVSMEEEVVEGRAEPMDEEVVEEKQVETETSDADMAQTDEAVSSVLSAHQTFLCSQCGCSFNAEQELAKHRTNEHGLAEALHSCTDCGLEFMSTTHFLYHRREHRKNIPSPSSRLNATLTSVAKHPPLSPALLFRRPESSSETTLPDATLEATAKLSRDWSRTPLPHECPHCGQGFTRRSLLREHVFQHTGEKLFNCNVCNKSFPTPAGLLRHSLCHGPPRSFTCPVCSKTFSQPASLKRHMLIHEEGSEKRGQGRSRGRGRPSGDSCLLTCPDCPASFKLDSQLQLHRLLHTSHPFPCTVCGQAFQRRKELDLHSLVHQDKEPVVCAQCGSQFLNQAVLDVHMQRCTGEPTQRRRYKGHGRGRVGGQLECDMCGHRCVTQDGLDLHRLSHTGQTPLRCPLTPCRKRFASSSSLAQHVVAHCRAPLSKRNTPRRYTCNFCSKEFSYASTFAVHMRTHTDERPFECTHCGKRFRQLPHLQDHERIHSGERPFVCWVCGKSFSVAARLAEHARVHSGERPFACPRCPTAFRSRPNLHKHLRLHASDLIDPITEAIADQDSAVQTILLVQEAASPTSSSGTASTSTSVPIIQEGTLMPEQHGTSVVFLHNNIAVPTVSMPTISVVAGQEVPHTIEFIIEETV